MSGLSYLNAQSIDTFSSISLDDMIDALSENSDCSSISNITSPNNSSLHNQGFESIAIYYFQNEPNFPFDSGLVMATKDVDSLMNGNNGETGDLNWPGDADLEALIQNNEDTFNATVLEFDFIPYQEELSVDYILASKEYDPNFDFICNFPDTFAFIVSGPGIPDVNSYNHDANPNTPDVDIDLGGLNIATINGTNIPVNPTNVHVEDTCDVGTMGEFAVAAAFDDVNSNNNVTEFQGQTLPLTATVDLIPGQNYHIKLVIGDSKDNIFDSAMFLDASSFEIGYIPEDLPLDPDFSDFELPDCWNQSDLTSFSITNNCSPTNENYLQLNGGNYTIDSAPVDADMVTALDVSFDLLSGCQNSPQAGENLEIEYFDGLNWNYLDSFDPINLPTTQSNNTSSNWMNVNYTFSEGLSKNFKIRFKRDGGSNNEDDINIANFNITASNSCPMPNNLNLDDVTTSSADFSWSEVPNYTGSYDYVIVNENDSPDTANPVASGNLSASVNLLSVDQLQENQDFDFYLISTCDSSLLGPLSFTTTTLSSIKFALDQIDVYPNPTTNQLFINNTNQMSIDSAVMFDMNGKLMKNINLDDGQTKVNISQFSTGIYFLKLSSGEVSVTKQIIKK
jgi:hypothetical protein